MRYHYISDSHVHSDCSFDGTDPVMMICERAAALGLYSIAVTDHCECDIYYKEGFDRSVVQSFFETRKARAVFYGRLQVYAGIELGQPITDVYKRQGSRWKPAGRTKRYLRQALRRSAPCRRPWDPQR